MSQTIKLHAHLAHLGICSRRKAEELIISGKVKVNGEKAHLGQRIDPTKEKISIEGKDINPKNEELVYFLIDKPVGIVSTTSDEQGRKNVMSLIPPQKQRLYPVGRLDQDSQGLMLLTNDGDLAYKLTHPSFKTFKTYEVLIQGAPKNSSLNKLKQGIKLKEGKTKPAQLKIIGHQQGNTRLEIIIHEGRNRQIRRMMGSVGHPVLSLKRTRFGPFDIKMLEGKKYKKIESNTFKI